MVSKRHLFRETLAGGYEEMEWIFQTHVLQELFRLLISGAVIIETRSNICWQISEGNIEDSGESGESVVV